MRCDQIPGFRLNDGRLMIFTGEEAMIIHTWPDLEAVRRVTEKSNWTPFVPRFRLLRPKPDTEGEAPDEPLGPAGVVSQRLDPLLEKLSAFLNFRRSIPSEIVAAVEHFPGRQMAVLRVCKRREQTRELIEQCPALGFAVAHNHRFRITGVSQV